MLPPKTLPDSTARRATGWVQRRCGDNGRPQYTVRIRYRGALRELPLHPDSPPDALQCGATVQGRILDQCFLPHKILIP